MLIKDLNSSLIGRVKSLDVNKPETRVYGLYALNIAFGEIWRAAWWTYRKKLGQVTLIPKYTTGTCSYTQGTKTVSFSGATLISSMAGRFWKPNNSSNSYLIIYVSGSSIYLSTEISEATASGQTYEIWKRFYYLNSDVDMVLDGFNHEESTVINQRGDSHISSEYGAAYGDGSTSLISEFGGNQFNDSEYSTGTISLTANNKIATGSGTSWLSSGVSAGDVLVKDSKEYYIKRVETDERIVLHNYAIADVAEGSSYVIRKKTPVGVQFYKTSENYRLIDYTYLTKPWKFVNEDYEHFPMDDDFEKVILERAESVILGDIDKDQKWINKLNTYQGMLTVLIDKKDVIRPKTPQFRPNIPSYMPGRG